MLRKIHFYCSIAAIVLMIVGVIGLLMEWEKPIVPGLWIAAIVLLTLSQLAFYVQRVFVDRKKLTAKQSQN